MTRALTQVLFRDLKLSLRQGSDLVALIMFFVITVSLFPFAVGPESDVLAHVAAGVIWVTALLATMLSLGRLFQGDFEDGSLDLLLTSVHPLELIVLTKIMAHWLVAGLPLVLAAPVLAVALRLPMDGFLILTTVMVVGTPTLSLIGAIGAALTLGARHSGVLNSILVLPLYIPILIFGIAAVDAGIAGLTVRPHLLILVAMLVAALPLAPWAAAAALRQTLS